MSDLHEMDHAPAQVRDLATECVQEVSRATGVTLDYTPDTLPVLDHYLASIPAEGTDRQARAAAAAGAYFGRVVQNGYPCRWYAPVDDYGTWRVEFEHVFLHFSPIAFAHEAIMRAEVVEGGSGFGVLDQDLEAVRAGLEALGTVGEEDYFKLSTRYEVLTTVVDRLTARSMGDDEPAVRFDAESYRVVLGEGDASNKPS